MEPFLSAPFRLHFGRGYERGDSITENKLFEWHRKENRGVEVVAFPYAVQVQVLPVLVHRFQSLS